MQIVSLWIQKLDFIYVTIPQTIIQFYCFSYYLEQPLFRDLTYEILFIVSIAFGILHIMIFIINYLLLFNRGQPLKQFMLPNQNQSTTATVKKMSIGIIFWVLPNFCFVIGFLNLQTQFSFIINKTYGIFVTCAINFSIVVMLKICFINSAGKTLFKYNFLGSVKITNFNNVCFIALSPYFCISFFIYTLYLRQNQRKFVVSHFVIFTLYWMLMTVVYIINKPTNFFINLIIIFQIIQLTLLLLIIYFNFTN